MTARFVVDWAELRFQEILQFLYEPRKLLCVLLCLDECAQLIYSCPVFRCHLFSRVPNFWGVWGIAFTIAIRMKRGHYTGVQETALRKWRMALCWCEGAKENLRWLWWAHQDLNLEPTDYESAALTVELWALRSTRPIVIQGLACVSQDLTQGSRRPHWRLESPSFAENQDGA
jgi:hypothetical protein